MKRITTALHKPASTLAKVGTSKHGGGAHHALYNTRAWRRRRAQQLSDHPLCVYCDRLGKVRLATVADHIERHDGDPIKFHGPLQSLCAPCHSGRKQREERRGPL